MNNFKKAAAITLMAGGMAAAGAGVASAHTPDAVGSAVHSPGVVSGNVIQAPVDVPVQVNGNSINVIGVLNPVWGNAGFLG
ncbi:chaplin [Streptomyces sp. DSM 44917]|uniref:Chaplin n=1 Tax=Streptomyces boetiae TaxID=3075541 RepID=A0ABU2LEU9_9ACTN|nr:chaplin [Streptomyces sp. DSM 44917]MDT0310101.1 chaplin [Streptomyces sp. DSM 44917]